MIDAARRAHHIRYLFYVKHWAVGAISDRLGLHRYAVYKAIESDGLVGAGPPVQPTMLDGDNGLVGPTLEPHPRDLRQRAWLEVAP